MLDAIGVSSIEELFDVPEGVRLDRALELPDGLSEAEVYERMRELASRNADAESEVCFLGAGMYDHYAPAIVDAIVSRSEFLTPYTPYQPEISQGGLQAMFEFQTAMTELTGLPLSSAGLYEGPSTVAAAGYLAIGATKRRRFVVSGGVNPQSRETLAHLHAPATRPRSPRSRWPAARTDLDALAAAVDDETAAVFVQYPNFLGSGRGPRADRRDRPRRRRAAGRRLRPDRARHPPHPGRLRRRHRRRRGPAARQPPRLRRPVLRLLLRDRGADPADARPDRRRDRSTSTAAAASCSPCRPASSTSAARRRTHNICTAQALNALGGMIYLSWLGRTGPRRARRAARPPHALRPRAPRRDRRRRGRSTTPPSSASSRSPSTRPSSASSTTAPPAASPPASRSAPSTATGCSSRSPSSGRSPRSIGWPSCSARPSRADRRRRQAEAAGVA